MDGTVLRYWPKAVGGALALLLLASLLSFDLQDPTLTNLRLPSGGIANWLGLPGALLGGSLLELLGSAALLAPLLWLNYALTARRRPAPHAYAFWCACLLVALSGLHGLAVAPVQPGPADPGLAGWAVRRWAGQTVGPWAAAALLATVAASALPRIAYAPVVRVAWRDARLFARWLLHDGWRRWRAGWLAVGVRAGRMRRVTGAAALGLQRSARLGLGDLLHAVLHALLRGPRAVAAWLAELRAPSLARIKNLALGRAADTVRGRSQAARAAGGPDERKGADDGFDDWFEQPAWGSAEPAAPEGHFAAPAAAPEADPPGPAAGGDASKPAHLRDLSMLAAALAAEEGGAPAVPPVAPLGTSAHESPAPDEGAAHTADEVSVGPDGTPLADRFEQPAAEAAWRERFQRYARNLDLDWEEQLWRRQDDEPAGESEAGDGDA